MNGFAKFATVVFGLTCGQGLLSAAKGYKQLSRIEASGSPENEAIKTGKQMMIGGIVVNGVGVLIAAAAFK